MDRLHLCINPEVLHNFRNPSVGHPRKALPCALSLARVLFLSLPYPRLHRAPLLLPFPHLASNPFSKHKSERTFPLPNNGLVRLEKDSPVLASKDKSPFHAVPQPALTLGKPFPLPTVPLAWEMLAIFKILIMPTSEALSSQTTIAPSFVWFRSHYYVMYIVLNCSLFLSIYLPVWGLLDSRNYIIALDSTALAHCPAHSRFGNV